MSFVAVVAVRGGATHAGGRGREPPGLGGRSRLPRVRSVPALRRRTPPVHFGLRVASPRRAPPRAPGRERGRGRAVAPAVEEDAGSRAGAGARRPGTSGGSSGGGGGTTGGSEEEARQI